MAVVKDCSSAPDHLEKDLDKKVEERSATVIATQEQVCTMCNHSK